MPRYTHEASPWLRRVLIPFWLIRVALMVLITASFALGIALIAKNNNNSDDDDDDDNNDDSKITEPGPNGNRTTKIGGKQIAVVVVFFVLVLVCLVLDIVSIVKFARRNLRPKTFLIFNTIQTIFWAVILVIDVVGSIKHGSALSFLFSLVVFALFLGLFIYAIIIYRRSRRDTARGDYAPTTNPAVAMQPAPYVSPSPIPAGSLNRLSARSAASGSYQTNAAMAPSTSSLGPQEQGLSLQPSPVNSPFSSQGPYVMTVQDAHVTPPPTAQGRGEDIEMGHR